MKCPRDGSDLVKQIRGEIEVDYCKTCEGLWLDLAELDELEDTVFDEDEYKGTLIFSDFPSEHRCPLCGSQLKQFKYRLHDLVLEYCPNKHGFWLDGDEDKRVLELMKQRIAGLQRKIDAENEWAKTLRRMRSKSFIAKLTDLFR